MTKNKTLRKLGVILAFSGFFLSKGMRSIKYLRMKGSGSGFTSLGCPRKCGLFCRKTRYRILEEL